MSSKVALPDCWTVSFGNCFNSSERVLASGYDNGDIKLFDLKAGRLLCEMNTNNGICDLQFDRKDIKMNKLIATTLEGNCLIYDLRTQHPEEGFACLSEKVGDSTIWGARVLPQNRDLMVTMNGDGVVKLFKYNYPDQRKLEDAEGLWKGVPGQIELLNDKKTAQQPIVAFDFNKGKIGLAVQAALDQTVKVLIMTKLHLY